jgi:hypothetical protein
MLTALGFASELRLYSFEFWDEAPAVGPSLATPKRRSVLRKFIRSPASYWRAGLATARAILERAIPELRPHMYAVAKKDRHRSARQADAYRSRALTRREEHKKNPRRSGGRFDCTYKTWGTCTEITLIPASPAVNSAPDNGASTLSIEKRW